MNIAKDRWKKGYQRVVSGRGSFDSLSSIDVDGGSLLNEEVLATNSTFDEAMELQAYITNMKKKTGLKNLWSGKKFENIVENDKTPDISISSDDDDLNSKIRNLKMTGLDSDEDEMRIEYMRELNERDENNNDVSSDQSLNLMGNIQLMELLPNDVELSDDVISKPDDYLPILHQPDKNSSKTLSRESSSSSRNSFASEKSLTIDDESRNSGSSGNKSNKSNESSVVTLHTENEVSEISEIRSYSRTSTSKSINQSESHDDVSETITRTELRTYSSRHVSSKSERKSKIKNQSSVTNSSTSSSHFSNTNSSLSRDNSKTSKSSKRNINKQKKKTSSKRNHISKAASTQTEKVDVSTEQVLNFRYAWQNTEPSNIAAHVVDEIAIDALTTYSPSVLAANDLMKYHMELLSKHIENSRRLYDAFTTQCGNKRYNYTTVEETLKYIEKNKPPVISYEEALKEVIDTT